MQPSNKYAIVAKEEEAGLAGDVSPVLKVKGASVAKENEASKEVVEEEEQRDVWGKDWEFILACVGYAVGLGNIWRFPYLCYKNGGGAFLVPYFIYVVLAGLPIMIMEVGMGQFMSQGNISVWNICPIFKGIGIGTTIMVFLCNTYYIVLLAWSLHYFFSSFSLVLPWNECGQWWNSDRCLATTGTSAANVTLAANMTARDSTLEYWEKKVLGMTDGLEEVGGMQWELVAMLFLAWLLVYGCVFKGVQSSGKVMYFTATFPYVMLTVLLIRGLTLDGAWQGVLYYVRPDFQRLTDRQVWLDAGTQVFYSYGCTFGGLVALGSYNHYHRDFVRDCTIIAGITGCSSFYGGVVIFSVLGYMSKTSGIPIEEVVSSGPGLAFIVYPKALSLMPGATIWAILFFFMLFVIAIDSQFVCVEGFITAIMDQFSPYLKFSYSREIVSGCICFFSFLLGLPMVTKGGIYVFNIFDNYAASGMTLLCFCFVECIAMAYVYGVNNWFTNVEDMIQRKPCWLLKLCWAVVTPGLSLALLLMSVSQYSRLTYNDYKYPLFGQIIAVCLALSSSIFVPLFFLYALIKTPGVKLAEKFKCAIRPDMEETLKIREQKRVRFERLKREKEEAAGLKA